MCGSSLAAKIGAQVFGRDRKHFGARNGVTGDAATEVAHPARGIARAFTEEVDVRDELAGSAARSVRTLAISQLLPTSS